MGAVSKTTDATFEADVLRRHRVGTGALLGDLDHLRLRADGQLVDAVCPGHHERVTRAEPLQRAGDPLHV